MKKLLLMKTMLLLCALIAGSSSAWATDAEFSYSDFSGQGTSSTGGSLTGATQGSITVTGTGYGNTSYLQVYAGNTLTITPNNGATITKIVLTGTSNTYIRTWTASDKSTVSVSSSKATWSGESTSAITLTNSASSQARITGIVVTYSGGSSTPVSGVTVDPTSWEIEVGETKALTATISPAAASNKKVSWESDDEGVATVNSSGVVTAVSEGTAQITVTTEDGSKTATCDITVVPVPAMAITLDFTSSNILSLPTSSTKTSTGYTYNGYTYTFAAADGYYYQGTNKYVMLGKSGSTLTFPAFPFDVTEIRIHGTSGASQSVAQNIFVGTTAVSTATTGARNVINKYRIASEYQAAGTIYILKVTSDANTQISKIQILGKEKTTEVSAAGWATYVTKNPVSFTEGDAFAVTSVGTSVDLTAVTDVPKGTPLLLKGAGAKTPVVLSADPDAITNKLAISDGDDGVNGYVLANHNSKVGFYKWTGSALASGKVYLPATEVPAGTREFFGFDDEATGIANINGEAKTLFNGEFYNIAGQRVAQPNKGLYIVNGKKVIIK